jgi:hypothetical protein
MVLLSGRLKSPALSLSVRSQYEGLQVICDLAGRSATFLTLNRAADAVDNPRTAIEARIEPGEGGGSPESPRGSDRLRTTIPPEALAYGCAADHERHDDQTGFDDSVGGRA